MKFYEIYDRKKKKDYEAWGTSYAKDLIQSIVVEHYASYIQDFIFKEQLHKKGIEPMTYKRFFMTDNLISISDGYDTLDRESVFKELKSNYIKNNGKRR